MPHKIKEVSDEYHREYMREYNKTHPLTPEQKSKKNEYQRQWTARNKEKQAEYQRLRYLRDKEKVQVRSKTYRQNNSEAIKANKHRYYIENRDKLSEKMRKHYEENKETIRSYKRDYAKTLVGKFISYTHSAKERGHEFSLTKEQFNEIFLQPCHYCNSERAYGIDRKDSRIGYEMNNVLPCCSICNYMKKNHAYDDFISHISRIHQNLR